MQESDLIKAFRAEQSAISDWWLTHSIDKENGGFAGEIDRQNRVSPEAPKGIIQNTRILWYFSEAARITGRTDERAAAERAFDFLCRYFVDRDHGGVFWQLDYQGRLTNGRKQIYAQAFALYAVSAYYRLTGDKAALALARDLFELIERYGLDTERGGYLEAFSREWAAIDDQRLSPKDLNCPKTMNTQLHLVEAYTGFFRAAPDTRVSMSLRGLIDDFRRFCIDDNAHLRSFLDLNWQDKSDTYSYGHDIECSWLLWEAVKSLDDPKLADELKPVVLDIARVCLREGTGEHGEIMDGYNYVTGQRMTERVWWIQAEAMVGFLNAFEISDDAAFFEAFENVWQFVRTYQIDLEHGEWHWLSTLDDPERFNHQKAGFWKGPYHNGRAMLEVVKRLERLRRSTLRITEQQNS